MAKKKTEEKTTTVEEPVVKEKAKQTAYDDIDSAESILTIDIGGQIQTDEEIAEIAWHEINNAYRTKRILTGMIGGIEQMDKGKTVAVVDYQGFRIIIPMNEMLMGYQINLSRKEFEDQAVRYNKLLSNMLGAEIDFIIKGIDEETRSVVASRKEAMLKKRKTFYMDADASGAYKIYEGRIVQARVLAVAEKGIRVEIFGVDCSISARDLSWDWIGDAHDRFAVGDEILVKVKEIIRDSVENIEVVADVKSVTEKNNVPNISRCQVQGKYAGRVTDIHKGIVFVRLTNGVNAIAHSCYDRRRPAKKDDVSFAVTGIDEERGVALGIITRIIKQNL